MGLDMYMRKIITPSDEEAKQFEGFEIAEIQQKAHCIGEDDYLNFQEVLPYAKKIKAISSTFDMKLPQLT